MYGYDTGIVGDISGPAINGYMNATFLADNGTSCVWRPEDPSVVSKTSTSSEIATWRGLFTANILVGMTLGASSGPFLADKFGRRTGLIVLSVLGVVPTLIMGLVNVFAAQLIARTVLGVALGMSATLTPLYVVETANADVRGQLGTIFQFSVCLSILVAQAINYVFDPQARSCAKPSTWMGEFMIGAVPGILSLVYCFFFIPETETWLSSQNGDERSPLRVNNSRTKVSSGRIGESGGYGELFSLSKQSWIWIGICVGLPLCQQLTGVNAIIFYGPAIFKSVNAGNPLLMNLFVVGVWNFVAVAISFFLIDRLGRRPLMLGGLLAMTIACAMMFVGSIVNQSSALASFLKIGSIVLYMGGFESGPGPLFFLMASETFPPRVRSEALTVANILCNLFNIFTSFMFPVLKDAMGIGNVFALCELHEWGQGKEGASQAFTSSKLWHLIKMLHITITLQIADAVMSAIGFVFVFTMLPETKGKNMTMDSLPSTAQVDSSRTASPRKGLYQAIE